MKCVQKLIWSVLLVSIFEGAGLASVVVSPASAQVKLRGQVQFSATGSADNVVIWSITGTGCSGVSCGKITSDGLYTAPAAAPTPPVVAVVATSLADLTQSGSASVAIGASISVGVTISPALATVVQSRQQQFTAVVTGSSNKAVKWRVSGTGCAAAACGTITSGGLYTAPALIPKPPQVTVTATSIASPTKSAAAKVSIEAATAVLVSVSPSTAQVFVRGQQQFSAKVTGTTNKSVKWTVAGTDCAGLACGSISVSGLYTAPASIPASPKVKITAASVAAPTRSAFATVTLASAASVVVSVSPSAAQVSVGKQQQFSATVTGATNKSVKWNVAGTGCAGVACGSISASGLYTAPASVPISPKITITAASVAAPTKSASATVSIESAPSVAVSVSPSSAQVSVGKQQQFSATVTGATNTSVKWTVAGTGCAGAACGSISASGLYTAPASVPNTPKVTITATSVAAPSKFSNATVTIIAPPSPLTVTPSSPQVKPRASLQFSASGPGVGVVIWSASGSGCSGITCGSITAAGLYTAPATAPNPATVIITAISLANTTISGSTTATIVAPGQVGVTVSPSSVQLNAGAQQLFNAAVTGTTNTAVTWSVTGFGCAGSACGTITSGGLYTAPTTPPNPSFVTVTATSVADSTKSNSATVTISEEIGVSISPTSAQIAEGATQQFIARVTGTTLTGVTWSVSGTGCSGSACGIISSKGLYTAPGTVPNPAQVTVTATANEDGETAASATVTIIVPVVVGISPTSAIVTVGQPQQFRTSVTGSTNTAVTWSISGSGCSGSTCGTITSGGLYTAPATVPSQATVIVKATSQANESASASAVVSIVATNNSKFVGQFAFLFTGFDSSGVYQEAGSFTADGKGNLKSGLEDVNDTAGPSSDLAIAGTYQMGSDNRGVLTINSPLGTHTFRFALNLLGTKGRLISFDQSGVRGSGVIELQDPTAFDPSVLVGGYVLNLTGMDVFGARIGALGLIFPDGSGFIAGSSLDVNDGGSVSSTFGSFSGNYSVDSTGRGTATLVIPGFDGGSFNFVFYVVSASELLLVSVDPLSSSNPIFSGPAEAQTGILFTGASFSGASVFSLSGTNGTAPDDTVGRFQFNGDSSVTVNFDQNNGGNITVGGVLTGAYDIELSGRGTLNLVNSADGSLVVWYLYAISANKAYIMDASTGAVAVGEMKPQTSVSPFSNSNILGTYLIGSGEPISETTPLYSGVAGFDGGTNVQGLGAVTGAEDISQASTLSPNQVLNATYSVSSVSNNGRGVILLTLPSGKTIAVWVISASEFVGLDTDSTTAQPTILHFEQ